MHGVRRELLRRQAQSIGLPLHEVRIPPQCVNPIYEARMEEALRAHFEQGVRKVAFGDIFLEDLRAYREKNLARIGMTAVFPIWKRDTRELVRSFPRQSISRRRRLRRSAKSSLPASPDANSTTPSSAIFRRKPTLAAKTASSTPSSSMAPFSNLPFLSAPEKSSTAMALCFAIYCPK